MRDLPNPFRKIIGLARQMRGWLDEVATGGAFQSKGWIRATGSELSVTPAPTSLWGEARIHLMQQHKAGSDEIHAVDDLFFLLALRRRLGCSASIKLNRPQKFSLERFAYLDDVRFSVTQDRRRGVRVESSDTFPPPPQVYEWSELFDDTMLNLEEFAASWTRPQKSAVDARPNSREQSDLSSSELRIDLEGMTLRYGNTEITIKRESVLAVLDELICNIGDRVSYSDLESAAGIAGMRASAVRVHRASNALKKLVTEARRALAHCGAPAKIVADRGIGYALKPSRR